MYWRCKNMNNSQLHWIIDARGMFQRKMFPKRIQIWLGWFFRKWFVGLYLSSMDNARCCPYMSIVHYEVIGGLVCRWGQYVMVDCCYCYCCCWVDEWLLCGLVECSSSGRGVNSQWRVAGGTEQGLEWQCCCCGWTHFHILKNLSRKHSPTWNGNTDATRTLLDTLSHSQKLV